MSRLMAIGFMLIMLSYAFTIVVAMKRHTKLNFRGFILTFIVLMSGVTMVIVGCVGNIDTAYSYGVNSVSIEELVEATYNRAIENTITELRIEDVDIVNGTVDIGIENNTYQYGFETNLISLGKFKCTGYCACMSCCGKTNGITSTGAKATANHTIAVDPTVIPYGSKLLINGIIYTAEDCGGAIKDKRLDIYFNTHEEALQFGVRNYEVYLIKEV